MMAGAIWRTSLTPEGPGTIRVLPAPVWVVSPDDESASTRVRAQAWGPGAGWLLDALPGALGRDDDVSGFDASCHPLIWDSARSNPGFRLGRSGRLMEALVPAILEQKVVILEAHRAWRILLSKFGTEPPGPAPRGMRVLPEPAVLAAHSVVGVAPGRGGGRPGGDDHQGFDASPRRLSGCSRSATRRPTASCGRSPASASGPRPRPGSGRRATRTRSPSATTT